MNTRQPGVKPSVLMTGIAMGESARWHEGRLWFSDWAAHEIWAVDPHGKSDLILRVPTFPFCFDWLPDGRLIIMSGGDGLVLRRERNGSLVTHAEVTPLSRYPWNEIVVDVRGNAYVNNICFNFPGREFAPGIIGLVRPDGSSRQVADGIAFPNGMAVTPDDKTLIVAESFAKKLTAFDIDADGGLSNRRTWANLAGSADGICLDAEGAVWCASLNQCVRMREGGAVLQTVDLDRFCFSCALGGEDGKTLFMMAAEWRGEIPSPDGERTGQVQTVRL